MHFPTSSIMYCIILPLSQYYFVVMCLQNYQNWLIHVLIYKYFYDVALQQFPCNCILSCQFIVSLYFIYRNASNVYTEPVQYLVLKKLSEVLVALGTQLYTLWVSTLWVFYISCHPSSKCNRNVLDVILTSFIYMQLQAC